MQSAEERAWEIRAVSPGASTGFLLKLERIWLAFLVIALLASANAKAQMGGTGTIEGTVTDPAGALVAGVRVSARNVATGSEIVRSTSKSGDYTLAPLDAGNYTVTVSAPGFEKLVR